MPEIHLGLAADTKFGSYLYFTMGSALLNANVDDVLHFHILSEGVLQEEKDRLQRLVDSYPGATLEIVEYDFSQCPFGSCGNPAYPQIVFSPLYFSTVFGQVERLIYLDCDILVRRSLSELWGTNLDNHALGAVLDYPNINNHSILPSIGVIGTSYFNAGVLLLDCLKWRNDSILDVMIEKYAECQFSFMDQDVLNAHFNGNFIRLNKTWNCQSGYQRTDADHVIHYTGQKPMNAFFVGGSEYFWEETLKLPESAKLLPHIQAEIKTWLPAKRKAYLNKCKLLACLGYNREHYNEKIQRYQLLFLYMDKLESHFQLQSR